MLERGLIYGPGVTSLDGSALRSLAGQVGRPVVHQPTPALEQARAPVGCLDPVLDHMRQGRLDDLARMIRSSAAQSRKLERNPWGTAAIPCFWNIRRSCFSSSCLPTRLGNRNGLVLSTSDRASYRISIARPHSGTRCSRFDFVRLIRLGESGGGAVPVGYGAISARFCGGAQSGSHRSVSTPCSPNPACGFPAPGSPVGPCVSHTERRTRNLRRTGGLRATSSQKLHGFTRIEPCPARRQACLRPDDIRPSQNARLARLLRLCM